MPRIIIILGLILCISINANSQGKIGFGAVGGMTLPVGDFGKVYNSGFGGNGLLFFQLSPGLEVTGTVGFLKWDAEVEMFEGSYSHTLSSIPLLVGLRYYFGEGSYAPYGGIEGGFHFLKTKVSGDGMVVESDREDLFGFGFGGGLLLRTADNLYIDLGIKFNMINDNEVDDYSSDFLSFMVGLRVGF